MLDLPAPLLETLAQLVKLTAQASQPWWIFGGAAMRLHGAIDIDPADVDVLLAPADARLILQNAGITQTSDGGSGPFRSEVFGTIASTPLPIDILGGFAVHDGANWHAVTLTSVDHITLPFGRVRVPSLPELIATTRQLGRPKDLARAARLEALLPRA